MKDKALFFVNYEGQRTAENLQQTLVVPTASMRAGIIQYPAAGANATIVLNPAQIARDGSELFSQWHLPVGPGRRSECACGIKSVPNAERLIGR